MNNAETPVASITEDRTVAILAYLTIVGFIIALVVHTGKKTRLGAYHLRQMLGLLITGLVGSALSIVPLLGWLASAIVWLGLIVLWVFGFVAALNREFKPVPLLGTYFQQWLGSAFD